MVMFAKFGLTGGTVLQSAPAATVKLPALPSPPKKLRGWQTTVPSALMARTALPTVQVPVTKFCLALIAVAAAPKFWFTLAADAGVPVTKVLGTVNVCARARGDVHASDREAKQRVVMRSVCICPPKLQV